MSVAVLGVVEGLSLFSAWLKFWVAVAMGLQRAGIWGWSVFDLSCRRGGRRRVPGALRVGRVGRVVVAWLVVALWGASAALAAQPGVIVEYAGNGGYAPPTPGPATSSALGYLNGVAVDSAGNLYIADTNNSEIEKVMPAGTLSVITGTGTAGTPTLGPAASSKLNKPQGVAVDFAGDLYIADSGNNEVEKITPAGTLSVIAGTGTPGAPTPGPAASSTLNNPQGVAVDSAGDLYIADAGNSEIERVTPVGTLSVIAGTGTFGQPSYGGPATSSALYYAQGVAVDSAGDVYVADTDQFTIGMISPAVPSNSAVPQVTGTPMVGQTLSAVPGAWSPTPTGYAYEWQDCDSAGNSCVAVTGATASTYALTSADIAHTIRVLVTASNSSGSAASASAPSTLVPAPPMTTTTATTTTTTTTTTSTPSSTTPAPPAPVVTPGYPNPTGRLASRTLGACAAGDDPRAVTRAIRR